MTRYVNVTLLMPATYYCWVTWSKQEDSTSYQSTRPWLHPLLRGTGAGLRHLSLFVPSEPSGKLAWASLWEEKWLPRGLSRWRRGAKSRTLTEGAGSTSAPQSCWRSAVRHRPHPALQVTAYGFNWSQSRATGQKTNQNTHCPGGRGGLSEPGEAAPPPSRRPTRRSGAERSSAAGRLLCPVRSASLCHGGCAAFGPVGGLLAGRRAQGAVEDSTAGEGGRWVPGSVVCGATPVSVALLEV